MNVLPPRLAYTIVVVVMVIWVADFAAQFLVTDHQTSPLIHGIFGSIVGGSIYLARNNRPGPPGSDTPPEVPGAAPQVEEEQGKAP